jgi:hypothetical protein
MSTSPASSGKKLGDDFVVFATTGLVADSAKMAVDRLLGTMHAFRYFLGSEPLRKQHQGFRLAPAKSEMGNELHCDMMGVSGSHCPNDSQQRCRIERPCNRNGTAKQRFLIEFPKIRAGDYHGRLARQPLQVRQQSFSATVWQSTFDDDDIHSALALKEPLGALQRGCHLHVNAIACELGHYSLGRIHVVLDQEHAESPSLEVEAALYHARSPPPRGMKCPYVPSRNTNTSTTSPKSCHGTGSSVKRGA